MFTCDITFTNIYSADEVTADISRISVCSAVQAAAHAHLSSVGKVQSVL